MSEAPELYWGRIAEISPAKLLTPGEQIRRTRVLGGWLVHGSATLLFIADASHSWQVDWQQLHNCSHNGKRRFDSSIMPATYRTATPGGWLIRSGAGLVEIPDPDHIWSGRGRVMGPEAEELSR